MIEISNVSKIYNRGKENEFYALNRVSLKIGDGEMVAIVGKSGAGKSTLMHIIGCIDDYEEGTYTLDGQDVGTFKDKEKSLLRNQWIGIVLQDFALLERYSVIENVLLPYNFHSGKPGKALQKQKAMELLKEMSMEHLCNQKINKLSGGQKQRVAIARAMITEPKILLADEPTGALDENTSREIMDIMKKLNEKGVTVIIITHDMTVAQQCNRIIEIKDGKINE